MLASWMTDKNAVRCMEGTVLRANPESQRHATGRPAGAMNGIALRRKAARTAPTTLLSPAAESAAALDKTYQAARAAVNAEAYALDTFPVIARHSPDYARRFDALRRATLAADSLRRARDKERKLAAKGR